jgi:hypothetical protein
MKIMSVPIEQSTIITARRMIARKAGTMIIRYLFIIM